MLLARKVAGKRQMVARKQSNSGCSGFLGFWNEDTLVETKNLRENTISGKKQKLVPMN
jgi:hypothetical protein